MNAEFLIGIETAFEKSSLSEEEVTKPMCEVVKMLVEGGVVGKNELTALSEEIKNSKFKLNHYRNSKGKDYRSFK